MNTGGADIFSFEYDEKSWYALQIENKVQHHLHMQCCGANVVLKKSKLGTKFFAHAKRGECSTAPESAEHLLAKLHIVEAIQCTDWIARPEQRGQAPDGESWIADVLAQKDNKKIAFEVQWSPQTLDETTRRQLKYKESNVRCLWLLKQIQLPTSKDVPAFRLRFDKENNSFEVLVPSPRYSANYISNKEKDDSYYWQQTIPLKEFIFGAISGKLRFAPVVGKKLPVDIYTAECECWKCKKKTNVVLSIDFMSSRLLKDHADFSTSIYDFDTPVGWSILNELLPSEKLQQHKIGSIKLRYGKTAGDKYLSNGCFHCDALQGQFYEHELSYDSEICFSSEISLTQQLIDLLEDNQNSIYCWWFNNEI